MKRIVVLFLLVAVVVSCSISLAEERIRGSKTVGENMDAGWYQILVNGEKAGTFYLPDGAKIDIPWDDSISFSVDEEETHRQELLHMGDSVEAAGENYRRSAERSTMIGKLGDMLDQHPIWTIKTGETQEAGVNFPAGWYRVMYMGDKDADASLIREGVKTDNGVYFFGEKVSTYKGIADVPYASYHWSKDEGTNYDYYEMPIPKGTRLQFESTGLGSYEELWIVLVDRL